MKEVEKLSNVISIHREGVKKGIYVLPNLCTTASLFCGFFAVIHALKSEFVMAAWAILIAGIFDFMDGRVARITHTESEFGVEYDSLVDLASFGLAPAILLYTWGLQDFNRIGWLAAFLYFACGALRLARFNVQATSVEKTWFQGLPIPVAAYVCASMIIFSEYIQPSWFSSGYPTLVITIAMAVLMVSTIPFRSFKNMHFRKKWSFFYLVIAVGAIFIIASEPNITIFLMSMGYVLMGLGEEIVTLRKSREFIEKIRARRMNESENDNDSAVEAEQGVNKEVI